MEQRLAGGQAGARTSCRPGLQNGFQDQCCVMGRPFPSILPSSGCPIGTATQQVPKACQTPAAGVSRKPSPAPRPAPLCFLVPVKLPAPTSNSTMKPARLQPRAGELCAQPQTSPRVTPLVPPPSSCLEGQWEELCFPRPSSEHPPPGGHRNQLPMVQV